MADARVFEQSALGVDEVAQGPAVITEAETTIFVPTGFSATLRSDGTVEVTRNTNAGAAA